LFIQQVPEGKGQICQLDSKGLICIKETKAAFLNRKKSNFSGKKKTYIYLKTYK